MKILVIFFSFLFVSSANRITDGYFYLRDRGRGREEDRREAGRERARARERGGRQTRATAVDYLIRTQTQHHVVVTIPQ